jgi:hypothetical protein
MGKYSSLWLIITGAIMLAVGAVLILALSGIPFAGGTMWLTGGILGIVGLVLIVVGVMARKRAAAVDQILATGTPGTAQITGLTQTGMYLNEQPQVELQLVVSVPGKAPYAARHKSFVPLILLGRLTSGQPLPVRVDPVDPNKVVVDWENAGFGSPMGGFGTIGGVQMGQPMQPMGGGYGQPMGGYGQPMGGMPAMGVQPMPDAQSMSGQPGTQPLTSADAAQMLSQPGSTMGGSSSSGESLAEVQAALAASGGSAPQTFQSPEQGNYNVEQLREWLRINGIPGTATINSATDTGKIVGDERLYTMSLTLELPGRPPQQLPESAAMVPLRAMHKVQVGWKVPVRVAPDNPNLTMFEWDKM